jgi:hypothetical protein
MFVLTYLIRYQPVTLWVSPKLIASMHDKLVPQWRRELDNPAILLQIFFRSKTVKRTNLLQNE